MGSQTMDMNTPPLIVRQSVSVPAARKIPTPSDRIVLQESEQPLALVVVNPFWHHATANVRARNLGRDFNCSTRSHSL
jgi:hypothetical protein